MTPYSMFSPLARTGRLVIAAGLVALLAGCAAQQLHNEGMELIAAGKPEEGIRSLESAVQKDPSNLEYRSDLIKNRSQVILKLLNTADAERAAARYPEAAAAYRRVLQVDHENARAKTGIANVEMDQRHNQAIARAQVLFDRRDLDGAQNALQPVLQENRDNRDAKLLQRKIDDALAEQAQTGPSLRPEFKKPITLQFRDANLKMVIEAISRTNNINILLDKDIKGDLRTTLFVKDAPFDDTLDLILMQNQLEKKILSDNTVFIYPNTPAKLKEFQDLKVRSFHLVNADAKQMQAMLKAVLKIKDMFVDEKTNSVIVRDTPDTIRLAEKMIAAQDQPEPEVMLEVEVMEISRSRLLELGVKLPQQVGVSVTGKAASQDIAYPNGVPVVTNNPAQPLTFETLKNITANDVTVSPLNASLDLRHETGEGDILASPRIRVRNKEKAKIHIGDRVPVITNSVTPVATGAPVVTGTVQYLEVGLKLDVEPDIRPDDDVAIKMALEVSNIVREVSSGPTLAYQIGSRSANTVLRLKDGETQVLAGLISDEDRNSAQKFPGLGDLPVVGRLFSSHKNDSRKTEIVLSITPHLTRAAQHPEAGNIEFWSGTESTLRSRPAVLRSTAATKSAAAVPVSLAAAAAAPAVASAPTQQIPISAPAAAVAAGRVATGEPASVTAPIGLSWQGSRLSRVGQEFQVAVLADSQQAMTTLSFALNYDPTALMLTRVNEGNLFKIGGKKTLFSDKVNQKDGEVFVQVARVGKDGIKGKGIVTTFTFRVLEARAQAPIVLKDVTPVGTDGHTLTFTPPQPFVTALHQKDGKPAADSKPDATEKTETADKADKTEKPQATDAADKPGADAKAAGDADKAKDTAPAPASEQDKKEP